MLRARAGSFALVGLLSLTLGACTTRVSVSSDEVQGNAASHDPSISENGRYVVFDSEATNLGAGSLFVRDLAAGTTTAVGNGGSLHEISADGRYVAFTSFSRLTPDDTGDDTDVFVWDRETGATTRASVGFGGRQGNANAAVPDTYGSIAISRNGRYVAFESSSPDLVAGDTNGLADIFVRDRTTGTTTRVPFESTGEPATEADRSTPVGLTHPVLSLDGRHIGFASARVYPAPNPVLRLSTDLYVRNLDTGATTRVTSGQPSGYAQFGFALDAHGHQAVFASAGLFVRNLDTGAVTPIPSTTLGLPQGQSPADPSVSRTGRFLAFSTDPYTASNVYVHDRETGRTRRLTRDHTAATQPYNLFPAISADGRWVAYESTDPTAVEGDTNDVPDVFVSSGRPVR